MTNTREIPGPGFYAGIPSGEYHDWRLCSSTKLHTLATKTAAHVHASGEKDSDAMRLGQAAHAAILEPDEFERRFELMPKLDRRYKDQKAEYAQRVEAAEQAGKIIVPHGDVELIESVRGAVWKHKCAKRILDRAEAYEASFVWNDPAGCRCKGRADILSRIGKQLFVVDVKTTRDASKFAFSKACANFGYFRQGAMYMRGMAAVGESCAGVILLVIEKSPPFCCAAYMLDPGDLDNAAPELEHWIGEYAKCEKSGVWPGYPDRITALELPQWAKA